MKWMVLGQKKKIFICFGLVEYILCLRFGRLVAECQRAQNFALVVYFEVPLLGVKLDTRHSAKVFISSMSGAGTMSPT